MDTYIIGCGGVGSWLAASISRLHGKERTKLVDGDTLEEKNLDRQLFSSMDIGRNKAEALGQLYGCEYLPQFYSMGVIEHQNWDWLLVGVDNNPARKAVLEACDYYGCSAIFGANETHSSEAYVYKPEWRGKPKLDPRLYYPQILTVSDNDPRAAAIGCTGKAQEQTPQLVSANFMAAALMQQLYVGWAMEGPTLSESARMALPHRAEATLSRISYTQTKESIK